MVDVINYIFGSLQASSNAIQSVTNILRKQVSFNRALIVLIFVIIIYAILVEIHSNGQDKKIEELSNDIEEIKRMKGE